VANTLSLLQGTIISEERAGGTFDDERVWSSDIFWKHTCSRTCRFGSEKVSIEKGGSLSSDTTTFTKHVRDVDLEGTLRAQMPIILTQRMPILN
jgi:hypothetical protein